MTQALSSPKRFGLLTTGVGYLNRVQEIEPDEGLPFLVVSISALRGLSENMRYTHFDCRVVGRSALAYVRQLARYVDRGDRVLVRFRASDIYIDSFTYRNGDKAGERGYSLKSKLIGIEWARVNGIAFTPVEDVA